MKTRTILTVSKFLALLGSLSFALVFGGQLLTLIASFINLDWAKRTYEADISLFNVREKSEWLFVCAMSIMITVSLLKAIIWYLVFDLLHKLKLQNPFTMEVEIKLEKIAYLFLAIWMFSSFIWKTYAHYLAKETGIALSTHNIGDEYLFIAGIVYIISQVFKRGIEIQDENRLTI